MLEWIGWIGTLASVGAAIPVLVDFVRTLRKEKSERAAAVQVANVRRWQIRQVDRAPDRLVYELTNVESDVATGVIVAAPEEFGKANLLRKLPDGIVIHPYEGVRFYLSLKSSTTPIFHFRVTWDGGSGVIPVLTDGEI